MFGRCSQQVEPIQQMEPFYRQTFHAGHTKLFALQQPKNNIPIKSILLFNYS